jgi:putative Holliday junction resolvase
VCPEMKGRILAIDPGKSRVGLALSDSLGLTAQGIDTYVRGRGDLFAHLETLVAEHDVTRIVLGLPLMLDGGDGEAARASRRFAERLRERLGLPVTLWDERHTSAAARAAIPPGRKKDWDKIAAMFILQSYMDSREPMEES